jgi:hypothetical protein
MVRIIARFAAILVLIVGKDISLFLLDAVLEAVTEQVILPVRGLMPRKVILNW